MTGFVRTSDADGMMGEMLVSAKCGRSNYKNRNTLLYVYFRVSVVGVYPINVRGYL